MWKNGFGFPEWFKDARCSPSNVQTLIQIVLRTIMNHQKQDISGDCMKLVIHWVEDLAIDVPHLLEKKAFCTAGEKNEQSEV